MADDDQARFIGDDDAPAPAGKAAHKPVRPKHKRDDEAAAGQRTVTILVVLFLLAGLVGVVLALPSFLKPPARPALLTVHVERYDHPGWGVAAGAGADAARLLAAFRDADAGRSAEADRNSLQADKLRGRLAEVAAGLAAPGAEDRPLVLSVSALGAVRPGDGAVCVLPTDADPFDPARWVPLDDVLAALATPNPVPRLLLLDLHRPTAEPMLGRAPEVVAAAIHKHLGGRQAAGTLPCPVLAAAAGGEASLFAPPAGCSAFGLYLADGLGGAAGGGGRNNEVTVAGLHRFVSHRVGRYARVVHGRPQTPQLYAPAGWADFTLTVGTTVTPPPVLAEPPKLEESYPKPLAGRWAEWDQLLAAGADRDRPEGFARLTAALLRAERGWLGTGDAVAAARECEQAFNDWRAEARPAGRPADDGPARAARVRLAARRAEKEPPPELATLLARYLSARADPEAKPEAWQPAQQAWEDKAAADPAAAGRLVWRRLSDDPEPTRGRVRALADALNKLTAGDRPPPLERLLVRFLAERRFDFEQGPAYPAEAVTAFLKAEDELGRALAAGPAGFTANRATLEAAEADRREGARLLFAAADSAGMRQAADRFRAATTGFARVAAAGAAPKPAAAVPALARAVLLHQPGAAAAGGDWFAAWGQAADVLGGLLADPADPATAARLVTAAGEAGRRLDGFLLKERVDELGKRPAPWGDADQLRPALALVAGAGLPAEARARAWDLLRREWAGLHDTARKRDADDIDTKAAVPDPAPPPPADPDPADARRAESARVLLGLALGGEPAGPPDAAWRQEVPERAARAVAARDWPRAVRAVRVAPPAAAAVRGGAMTVTADDLARPAADDAAGFARWLADQVRAGYEAQASGRPLRDALGLGELLRGLAD